MSVMKKVMNFWVPLYIEKCLSSRTTEPSPEGLSSMKIGT
jgi:hypothetical protein